MIFLIAYDRRTQRLMQEVETFSDEQREDAYRRRLEAELALPKEEDRYEVVLLEGRSREAIELTHARYFFDPRALVRSTRVTLQKKSKQLRDNGKRQPSP
jgi:hypothetical protein